MDSKKFFKVTDENGKETEYEIITAFFLSNTEKNYIIYTDNSSDKNGNLNIYASIYYPDDDTKLDSIETEEEWKEIEKILANLNKIKGANYEE